MRMIPESVIRETTFETATPTKRVSDNFCIVWVWLLW